MERKEKNMHGCVIIGFIFCNKSACSLQFSLKLTIQTVKIVTKVNIETGANKNLFENTKWFNGLVAHVELKDFKVLTLCFLHSCFLFSR